MEYLVFLATEDEWCTIYTTDSIPDVGMLMAAVPNAACAEKNAGNHCEDWEGERWTDDPLFILLPMFAVLWGLLILLREGASSPSPPS